MEKTIFEVMKIVEDKLEIPIEKTLPKKLFVFFGVPGSGKTTLAKEIKKRYPSVYISSDEIAIDQNLDLSDKYQWTFEIMNCLIDKYLAEGFNVIADCNADKYEIRKQLYDIAANRDAVPCVFWVKTEIAMIEQRQKIRAEKVVAQLRSEHLFYVSPKELKKFADEIEKPNLPEHIYIINGTEDIQKQLAEWEKMFIF